MIFLTDVASEIGRNRYFAGTDQRDWVRLLDVDYGPEFCQ